MAKDKMSNFFTEASSAGMLLLKNIGKKLLLLVYSILGLFIPSLKTKAKELKQQMEVDSSVTSAIQSQAVNARASAAPASASTADPLSQVTVASFKLNNAMRPT